MKIDNKVKESKRTGQVDSIRISLASTQQLKKVATRILPNNEIVGKITSSQTVNYKTLRPVKGGLFCERIFGPIKDFECACGQRKTKDTQEVCPDCGVEYTLSLFRRQHLGYIELHSPVSHIWFLKGRISYISILLGFRRKWFEEVTYCREDLETLRPRKLTFFFSPSVKKCFKKLPDYSRKVKLYWGSLERRERQLEQHKEFIEYIDKLESNEIVDFLNPKSQRFKFKILLPISQGYSWVLDHEYFVYGLPEFKKYMAALPEEEDIPIPLYSIPIKNLKINLSNLNFFGGLQEFNKTGASAIKNKLDRLDYFTLERVLRNEVRKLNEEIEELEKQLFLIIPDQRRLQRLFTHRSKLTRRLKLTRDFLRSRSRPRWMILSIIPVIPPDLRPIVPLDGDQVAISDLNKLYQTIYFRNERIAYSPTRKARGLLQEAVDALIENGKGGSETVRASNDRPLKSLSDILKGKKGRFRQNLLGKRVDYSGRSVIVVGPTLKLHQCGLPREMAIELFQPFLIRKLLVKKITQTIVTAKKLINQQPPLIWPLLEEVLEHHPILLNRAPTLHRLGIQAFQPKLIKGRAILLHPLVCPAFNADFDGDQMGVHVPLSLQAQYEAWNLMWSRNNLISPATGQPIIVPSQDMVLGCYYLSTFNPKIQLNSLPSSNRGQNISETKTLQKRPIPSPKKKLLGIPSVLFCEALNKTEGPLLEKKSMFVKKYKEGPSKKKVKTLSFQNTKIVPRIPSEVKSNPNQRSDKKGPFKVLSNLKSSDLPDNHFTKNASSILKDKESNKNNVLQKNSKISHYFSDSNDLLKAYYRKQIDLHQSVWVRNNGSLETEKTLESPLEIRVNPFGQYNQIFSTYQYLYDPNGQKFKQYVRTTSGRVLLNTLIFDCDR